MDWGMKNRLSKIISPKTGKTVMLAVDHGYFQGPTTGLRDFKKTVEPLIPYADCLFITRGMLRNCVDSDTKIPIFLRVSGGPSVLKDDLSDEHITTSMLEALRLNAIGVGMSIFVGGINESNIDEVLMAGAKNVAIISSIVSKKDVAARVKMFIEKIGYKQILK